MGAIKTVAIVGCGIGRNHIIEGYKPHEDKFRVVALCDLNPERLNTLADEFGVERRVTDFAEVLRMKDIDIVDICTPPFLHYEQIMAVLGAGKHAICEKPLVGSLAELDRIIAAEKTSATTLMPIFQYRFGNGIGQAKAIIDAGIAGKPYIGTVETFWRRGAEYYAVPWRGKWKTEIGGTLMGHALHPHDLFTYLMGPVRSLFGRTTTRVNAVEVDDCVSVSLEMESGALASWTATVGSVDQLTRIRLAFENVTFESDHAPYQPGTKPWTILPANPKAEAQIADLLKSWVDMPPRFTTQMALYHRALSGDGPMPVTTADARQALEVATAIYFSSRAHEEVTLPLGTAHPFYEGWAEKM